MSGNSRSTKFETLPPEERRLLLSALEVSEEGMSCDICGKLVTYSDCAILTPVLKKRKDVDILCDSPLCLCEWMEKEEVLNGG